MKTRIWLAVILTAAAGLDGFQAQTGRAGQTPEVVVTVDPRVELMSIIFRLAGNPEYGQGKVPGYLQDIDRQFGPFKSDPAVAMAGRLRSTRGVSYDAVMGMAVHLTDAFELKEAVSLDPRPDSLDERWTPASAREFLVLARKFAAVADFKGFIERHRLLYQKTAERARAMLDKEGHLEWYEAFYGRKADSDFHLVLGLVNGPACYGVHFDKPDGRKDIYSILGVWKVDAQGDPVFEPNMTSTIIHEFNHSYTNPLIDRFLDDLKPAAEKIFGFVAKDMERQAYGTWRTMLYESLDRACVLRNTLAYRGAAAAARAAAHEESRSFYWVGDLASLLGEYDTRAWVYPDLVAFFPKIVAFFNDYAETIDVKLAAVKEKKARELQEWKDKGPRIVSMVPANGATDVDPNLKAIVITFDRPMKDRQWAVIIQGDFDHFPKNSGVGYDKDLKVFTITLSQKLKPDWEYVFGLNDEDTPAFASREGIPLYPVVVRFKTRK